MSGYLAVPQEQRSRLVHEKARARRRGEIHWLRAYIGDVLDDLELNRETITVRFVALAFPMLAARVDWIVPDDPAAIARELGLSRRTQHVAAALDRLVAIGRIERIGIPGTPLPGGGFQGSLDFSTTETTPRRSPDDTETTPTRSQDDAETLPADLRSQASSGTTSASQRLARTRGAEQSREDLERIAEQNALGARASALPDDSLNGQGPVVLGRIIGLACKGDAASAAIVTAEAAGMPEHVLARALESLIGRRPRPANPAGYVVNAIRSIAAENGIVRERARVEREPEL